MPEDPRIVEKKSRLLRRSGVGFYSVATAIGWAPDSVIQAGVGLHHHEIDVLLEAWPILRGYFYGFEPHPETYEEIKGTYPGIVSKAALGAVDDVSTFYGRRAHRDGSSLYPHEDVVEKGDKFETEIVALDRAPPPWFYGDDQKQHTLLWLDCEGGELEALKGATGTLNRIEAINIEMTPRARSKAWCSPIDVHNMLIYHNLFLQWIHTQRCSHGQCDFVYVKPHLFSPDHCCVPQELERWKKLHG